MIAMVLAKEDRTICPKCNQLFVTRLEAQLRNYVQSMSKYNQERFQVLTHIGMCDK